MGKSRHWWGNRGLLIWRTDELAQPPRIVAVEGMPWRLALNPDGHHAVVGSLDMSQGKSPPSARYYVFDLDHLNNPPQLLAELHSFVQDLKISDDGAYLAVAANDELVLWSLRDGHAAFRVAVSRASTEFRAVALSHDGRWLAAGTSTGEVSLFSVPGAEPTARLAPCRVFRARSRSTMTVRSTPSQLVASVTGRSRPASCRVGTTLKHSWKSRTRKLEASV